MSVSVTGIPSIESINTKRISGLESGLDTEAVIKGLTSDIENKIKVANQQKQLLNWKRDAYRSVINKLLDFYNKYYTATSTKLETMLSQSSVVVSKPEYVSVVAGSNVPKADIIIRNIVSLATSSKLESSAPVSRPITIQVDDTRLDQLAGKSMVVTLDGVKKTITFSDREYTSIDSVKEELQLQLNKAFGANRITVSENGGALTLQAAGNSLVVDKPAEEGQDPSAILGYIPGQRNYISLNDKLSDVSLNISPGSTILFTINGKEFEFTGDNTLNDVINAVNRSDAGVTMSYSSLTDTFTLTAKQTGTGNMITVSDQAGSLMQALFGEGVFTEGTNAVIEISTAAGSSDPDALTYTTVVKSSNTFEIDGITYTLLGKAPGEVNENIQIRVDYDVDKAVEAIKGFVNDYNDLLKTITDLLSEPKYKDFPPLTDEQRAAIGKDMAAEYDAKAKSGLLRGDSYLNAIATSLRNALIQNVRQLGNNDLDIGLALAQIGITSGPYTEKGQLRIDESKLRATLSERPDQVRQLFTQKSSVAYSPTAEPDQVQKRYLESGLAFRIYDILQNNIRSSSGILMKLVGLPNQDYTTTYAIRIRQLDNKIARLNEQLTKAQDFYWEKFTRMETALSELNAKSAWLAQQMMMGSGY